eukprot:356225-Chlamydomonas_euryale.AAC.6
MVWPCPCRGAARRRVTAWRGRAHTASLATNDPLPYLMADVGKVEAFEVTRRVVGMVQLSQRNAWVDAVPLKLCYLSLQDMLWTSQGGAGVEQGQFRQARWST